MVCPAAGSQWQTALEVSFAECQDGSYAKDQTRHDTTGQYSYPRSGTGHAAGGT